MITPRGQLVGTIASFLPIFVLIVFDLLPKPDRFGMIHWLSPLPTLVLLSMTAVMVYKLDSATQKAAEHYANLALEIDEYNRENPRD